MVIKQCLVFSRMKQALLDPVATINNIFFIELFVGFGSEEMPQNILDCDKRKLLDHRGFRSSQLNKMVWYQEEIR